MIHAHGYWLDNHPSAMDHSLAIELAELFRGKSVLDLGCGREALYVKFFRSKGIECDGYDGNPLTEIGTVADLALPFDLGRQFDCVLSLEVGEHLPAEFESVFLDNVAKHCRETAVLSWAIPGQPGHGHVNCQDNAAIVGKMESRGFQFDIETTQRLRGKCRLPWLPNTLMVFLRCSA